MRFRYQGIERERPRVLLVELCDLEVCEPGSVEESEAGKYESEVESMGVSSTGEGSSSCRLGWRERLSSSAMTVCRFRVHECQ